MTEPVVIVGYGTAGVNAAIALRSSGYAGKIQVLSNIATPPYSPVLTTYHAANMAPYDKCFPWRESELAALRLDVVSDCAVAGLDAAAHKLETSKGTYAYSKCIVASGGSPSLSGFPQAQGFCPLTMRTMDDAVRLKALLEQRKPAHVVVSGASMVALKVTEACLAHGARVSLVSRGEHILRKSALPEVAGFFEQTLTAWGVALKLGQTVVSAEAANAGPAGSASSTDPAGQCAAKVTLSGGETLNADAVVVAHGMAPNTSFLPQSMLSAGGGVVVDEHMRTCDPDVYAAGDVALVSDLITKEKRIGGSWKEACLQGACAGKAIAAELGGKVPSDDSAYRGFVQSNSIAVYDATLILGGSISLNGDRRVKWQDGAGDVVGCIYEKVPATTGAAAHGSVATGDAAAERLVGFNVYTNNGKPESPAYVLADQLYRRVAAAAG